VWTDRCIDFDSTMKRSHEIRLRDALLPPGLLSLARFPLALAFPVAWPRPALAAGVVALAAVTDVLDGFVARKFHQETETGALLDPLMDKTFVLGVAATLIAARVVTPLEAALLSTRELVELPLVAYVMASRVPGDRRANMAGKLTTVLQFIAVGAILVHVDARLRTTAIAATAIAGAVAGLTYWARALHDARQRAA
jgi:CDP-diacylglycerol--glycerol-3-phosphate 3-phosphatidyltransferase